MYHSLEKDPEDQELILKVQPLFDTFTEMI